MNGARDERRDCEGQVDHLSQMLEDTATITFVSGYGTPTAISTASCSYLTPGYSDKSWRPTAADLSSIALRWGRRSSRYESA